MVKRTSTITPQRPRTRRRIWKQQERRNWFLKPDVSQFQDSSTAIGVVHRTFYEWLRINGPNFWREEILIVVPNEIAVLLSLWWNMELLQENKWTTFNNIVTSSLILMARGNLRIDRLLCLPTNSHLVILYYFPSIYFLSNPAVCKSVEGSVRYDGVVDVCTSHSNVMISNWILQQPEETDMGRS